MTADLVAPAIIALATATAGGFLRRRLPPNVAVVLLTLFAVLGAAAVVWALVLIVIGGLIGAPDLLERLAWCRRVLTASHRAPWQLAAAAAGALAVGLIRALGFERAWRRTVRRHEGPGGLDVITTASPVAFASPGRPGTVVISEGLLALLDGDEQRAVIAHERTHLEHSHARYLHAAGLAAAAVPLLEPLTRQLRFATERDADEGAAAVVGDRRTVARAIARAALATAPAGVLAVGGDSVSARVAELLDPPPARWLPVAGVFAAVGAASATIVASSLQLHHLVAFATHVCKL